ncbi:hypothetical protein [Spirosoma linguale]|uniref:Uncharacterized protein n=1 Tax=Spirosoma linguale (strain ATCC 33905 / DSM 74 / LMG 10896 / Claus 1) TaxID=504472 RepID=D2QVB0_SPILD|nr:hypothetical protein Slin_6792 [Spirosoma linguale DSM 74]
MLFAKKMQRMDNFTNQPKPLSQQEAKELIKHLSQEEPADLDSGLYTRCARTVSRLWLTTGQLDVAATIFAAVANQAHQLNKSIDWITSELGFEIIAFQEKGRRQELILYRLKEDTASDDALDLFNERLVRFGSCDHTRDLYS